MTTETSKTKPRAPGISPLGEDIDERTISKPIAPPIPPLPYITHSCILALLASRIPK